MSVQLGGKMTYVIDLTSKHPTYRAALEEFLKHPCVKDGVLCEYGSPTRGDLDITWWHKRTREVNMDRVCARLTNPVWTDDRVSFTCEPYGPLKGVFTQAQEKMSFSISTRKEERPRSGDISKVYALDMIDSTRHIDYTPQ